MKCEANSQEVLRGWGLRLNPNVLEIGFSWLFVFACLSKDMIINTLCILKLNGKQC